MGALRSRIKSFLHEHETLLQDALGQPIAAPAVRRCRPRSRFPNTLLTALLRLCVSAQRNQSFVCQTDIVELEEPFAFNVRVWHQGRQRVSNQQTWSAIELQSADHILKSPAHRISRSLGKCSQSQRSIVQRDKPTGTNQIELCTTFIFGCFQSVL